MKQTSMTSLLRRSVLAVALLSLVAGSASTQTIDLVADQYDFNGITMWGFASDTGQACEAGGAWAIGPELRVDAAGNPSATSLTVNLRNCLGEPVSIVIPAQPASLNPQTTVDGQGRTRVVALTNEAAAFGSVTYTWTGLNTGSYLYHSGSRPAKQVQMGLFGALIVDFDATAKMAYDGVSYDSEVVFIYSDIDPALHDPVPSTPKALNYKPKYFLVNGVADGSTSLSGPTINQSLLIRLINASFKTYAPVLLGEHMDFVAEDGNRYPYVRTQYEALLGPGQTKDGLWVPVTPGVHALYDRRLHLSTNGVPGGGLIAYIDIADVTGAPIADAGPDQDQVTVGVAITLDGNASSDPDLDPLTYNWTLVSVPAGSTAALAGATTADPTFTPNVPGTYVAELIVNDGTSNSAPDSVIVTTNAAPIADAGPAQSVDTLVLVTLDSSGSYDPDGDPFTYLWSLAAPTGSLATLDFPASANPSFTPDVGGEYSATLVINDGELDSAPASVAISAGTHVNTAPIAVNDFATVTWYKGNEAPTSVLIDVVFNDSDPDGNLVSDSTVIVTQPTQGGTVVVEFNGTVTFTPRKSWRGTDVFTYQVFDTDGAPSNVANVRVNVTK